MPSFLPVAIVLAISHCLPVHASIIELRAGNVDTEKTKEIPQLEVSLQDEEQRPYLINLKEVNEDIKKSISNIIHESLEEYIPENTFVILASHPEIYEIQKLPGVAWVGDYKPGYKVSPDIGKGARKLTVLLGHDMHRGEEESLRFAQILSESCKITATMATSKTLLLSLKDEQDALKIASCTSNHHPVLWIEERKDVKVWSAPTTGSTHNLHDPATEIHFRSTDL